MSHKPGWGLFLFVLVMAAESAFGQSPCPTSVLQGANAKISNDLICVMPQVYGPGGLVGSNNGGPLNPTHGHEVHFQASTVRSFEPINSEIGIELSQLPIASPVAGFIFAGGAISPTESFGPVLTDRAETIGKHKLFIGASYQYFNFDKVDGVDLKNFGVVLTHEPEPTLCSTFPSIPCQNGQPIFTHDIVATQNRIDLRVHQMTFVATYGLTGRWDVSVAVPVLDVRMALTSSATIFNFEPPPVNHSLDLTTPVATESIPDPNDPYHAIFSNFHSKLGIGDVTLRTKLQAWQSQREGSAVAVGLDVRLPTGDAYSFLGAGTWGIRPFATFTHSGRLSPHATAGFEINGNSVLAGDVTTQPVTKSKLPDLFTYSAGADFSLARRISLTGDFIGVSLLQAPKIVETTFTDYAGGVHDNISTVTSTVSELSVSAGGKLRLVGHLLLVGNVLFRVNDGGLHSKPAPLAGLSYTFR